MNSNVKTKLDSFLKFLREAFIVDFSKPLSIKNQFMVMFVTLFVSTILFGVVCVVNNSLIGVSGVSPAAPALQETGGEAATSTAGVSQPQESSKKVIDSTELLQKMTTLQKSYNEIYNGDLILVNKDHDCHHDGENVVSLLDVKTNTYIVADASVSVDRSIVDSVNQMFDDFYALYGESDVMIACGYRSSELQRELYDAEAEQKGDDAGSWVAPPGYSEHQTGYVFDLDLLIEDGTSGIDYDGEGIYAWINENCYQYGFILHYLKGKETTTGYEYEPWHFRYVGIPAATYMMKHGITLEEYIQMLEKNYSAEKPLVIEGDNEKVWCTYYIKADEDSDTDIPVPENYRYTVSGDNFSGFIVTAAINDDSFSVESSQEEESEERDSYEEPVYDDESDYDYDDYDTEE